MPSDSLRILVNDRCLRGPRTGVGHYLAELLAEVPRHDPEIEFVGMFKGLWPRGESARQRGDAAPRPARQPRRYSWPLRHRMLRSYHLALRTLGRIKHCAVYHEPNHIPMAWPGPTLTTIHDLSVLRFPDWHPADRLRWYEADFAAGVASTAHFVAVSHFTRREMIELLRIPTERVTVIPPGVNAMFRPQSAGQVSTWLAGRHLPLRYFLYVGTMEPRKNLPGLLNAYARLSPPLRSRFPLLAAGVAGWGLEQLGPMMQNLGIQGSVWPLGYVPEQDLPCLYAGAAALVWPSFYEGFGVPPLEAAACGTPVISSNTSAMPDVLGDAAVLVHPQDEAGLAVAMRRIVEDEPFAAELREKGLVRSQQFTWAHCAVQHARLYHWLAGH